MNKDDVILIAGAGGVLGCAIKEKLMSQGYNNVLTPSRSELNCLDEGGVADYIKRNAPDFVFHLASLVYGIKGNLQNQANSYKQNTLMSLYLPEACANAGVKKIFYAGTVASYPYPYINLPLTENDFWSGKPHAGEYGYALAKRNALGYLEILRQSSGMDYCYGIFTNLYGANDKFNTDTGHVIPSLVAKTLVAENCPRGILEVWGNPLVTRDFLYAPDAAEAAVLAMNQYCGELNIASGCETSMGELANALVDAAAAPISIKWMGDQPVGIPKRYCDVSVLSELGFSAKYDIRSGVKATLDWYRANLNVARK